MDTLTSHPRDSELRDLVDATARLRAISDSDLLRSYRILTHRLHAANQWRSGDGVPPDSRGLRAQRDLVEVELLRRMGAQS